TILIAHIVRPAAVALLAHSADHDHPPAVELAGSAAGRRDKSCQRALGVHAAPAIQNLALAPYRDKTWHRIDVAQQDDGLPPRADFAHGVGGRVYRGAQSSGRHLVDQVVHGLGFLAGWAIN